MDRSMLARATEGTDAPTPGYLYVDLAKSASASPTTCHDMAVYLSKRLSSKNNPNIKFKCCKVIAKLCDSVPRNQFRRCIAQDPAAVSFIKEAMNYRGTPDPVRGDEPNQKVRMAAKEALDAVYREAPSSETMTPSSASSSSMSGYGGGGGFGGGGGGITSSYGPPPHASHGGGGYGGQGGGMGSGRRMEGIGNPRYSDPRLDPRPAGNATEKVKNAVMEAGEVVLGMIKDPLARNAGVPQGQQYDYPRQGHSGNLPGYGNHSQYAGRPPPGAAELARQTAGEWTMASNRGPSAVAPAMTNGAPGGAWGGASTGAVGGSWASAPTGPPPPPPSNNYGTPSVTITPMPGAPSSVPMGGSANDGTYEKNLVLELCPPGGMKPVPPPDKLANFGRAVNSLNSDLICPVLLDLLEDGQPWIIRAKALCVMETAIQNGTKPETGSNPYRDFFHACREEVAPLALHPRAAIKDPAGRVLQMLGVAIPTDPGSAVAAPPVAAPPAAAPPAAPAPNLLDFDVQPTPQSTAAAAAPPVAPPPQIPGSTVSLFGGMQLKTTEQSAPAAAPVPVAPAVASENLLDFAGGTPNTAAPSSTATADASAAQDMFAPAPSTSTETPAAETAATDMFASMTLKHEDKKMETENELKSLSSGSAFGFINADAGATAKEDANAAHSLPATGTPAQRSSSDSFDPLKNLTPNTANQQRKMMQFSPEQMQAMAYQQMMMQQQYQQMLQMQAMAGGKLPVAGGMPMTPFLAVPGAGGAGVMANRGGAGGASGGAGTFFAPPKPVQRDDKKFDFVKDAMQTESKKK